MRIIDLLFEVIVDASDSCNVAQFDIGATGDTREWDIKGESKQTTA